MKPANYSNNIWPQTQVKGQWSLQAIIYTTGNDHKLLCHAKYQMLYH